MNKIDLRFIASKMRFRKAITYAPIELVIELKNEVERELKRRDKKK